MKPRNLALLLWLFGVFGLLVGGSLFPRNRGDGIHMNDDGQASYLEGEACTVNYTPDAAAFQKRLDWCADWYTRDRAHAMEKTP